MAEFNRSGNPEDGGDDEIARRSDQHNADPLSWSAGSADEPDNC
jgi:hypothetical protein